MIGFFLDTGPSKIALPVLPSCGQCGLYKKCRTPKMKVAGRGRREILVVGESPGKDEDRSGEPFTGVSGWNFRQTLATNGIDAFRDCWLMNALSCHGPSHKRAVDWCRPLVVKAIEELKPKVILLLGARAVKSVVGWLWKEDTGGIMRWAGFRSPSQQLNAWVCPTYNPAFVMREDRSKPTTRLFYEDHIKRAVAKRERPWKIVPDWIKTIDCEMDVKLASRKIAARFGLKPIAFDFETNMLKPDAPNSRVYCCSISDGSYTIAFPWHGAAAEETKKLLTSRCKKVGFNMKFEDRWCRDRLGVQVANWEHDGMQVSHCLDCRAAINSLKFQAFVRLGQGDYDSHIKPYLRSDDGGGYGVNRIKDLPLIQVLRYCGMDSLLEWKVWRHQVKEMSRG